MALAAMAMEAWAVVAMAMAAGAHLAMEGIIPVASTETPPHLLSPHHGNLVPPCFGLNPWPCMDSTSHLPL